MLKTMELPFLKGEQKMCAVTRSFDWSTTALGLPETWPQALQTAVGLCLNSPNPIVILWGPDMIQIYNDGYRSLIGEKKHAIALGRKNKITWAEIWPDIEPMLNKVLYEGEAVFTTDHHYRIFRNEFLEDAYFTTSFIPIYSEGKVSGIFANSVETTEKVLMTKKATEGEQNTRNVFMQAPMGICTLEGYDMKVTLANKTILDLWRRDESVVGKNLLDFMPELEDQGFMQILRNVYTTGEPFYAYERLAQIEHNNKLNDHYFDFVYAPYKQYDVITGVMAVATEVTSQVEARKQVVESEKRFRSLIIEAPMATALYVGREMKIEVANETMLNLWGKDSSVIGMTLRDALPELEGQPFHQLLDNVFTSGKAYHSDMQSADLIVEGKLQRYWFNFTYKPLHDSAGNVYAILNMAVDITKQVHLQQQKDEFLGIASHELKTPVTSIKAYTQVLQQMMKQPEFVQQSAMLTRMDKQINKLTNLIENLLDVTKIQAGKLEFNERSFEFNELVKEVVTDMQAILPSHHIELDCDVPSIVFADRERIEQVLTNLISNAAKYSPHAERILVKTKTVNGTVTCYVHDEGVGIPQENMENIFDQFYQVNRRNMHRFSGLGLGLYISAEIIRRSNGTIQVESKEGEGSTFSFTLNTIQ